MKTMTTKSSGKCLEDYLSARRPIIYIQNFDFKSVDVLLSEFGVRGMGGGKVCRIEEYSEAGGWISFETKSPRNPRCRCSLEDFLDKFNTSQLNNDRNNYLLILREIHESLSNPRVCSLLQTIAWRLKVAQEQSGNKYRVQIVIVDSQLRIPPELEKLITVVEMKSPDRKAIEAIIDKVVESECAEVDPDSRTELVTALMGLSEFEIRQILDLALEDKILNRNDLSLVHEEKRQLISKSGLLELIETNTIGEVGGLGKLRDFIATNKTIFQNPGLAREYGVDAPAGIMIVGMPGCGKSLMAKTIAKEFEIPLLKLDVGRLMGKYVGESEGNLHRAISVAEAAAPCVLWIDEIEKAFSGIGDEGGGGSSMTRMFGIFLTWMQEKTSNIYVVATANNIDKLPPEFLRRGRFDEIFQVKYPDAVERRQILELHIRRRNNNELPDGLAEVLHELKNAENYSGADIESIVKEAMKQVFNHNVNTYGLNKRDQWEKISSDVLTSVIKETRSSYHSQKEKLDKMMRKLNELDAKSAS